MSKITVVGLLIVMVINIFQDVYSEIRLEGHSESIKPIENQIIIKQDFGQLNENILSHYFSKFNVMKNDHVIFKGDETIRHIVSYIKDVSPSNINGKITCDIQNANLFLINQNGIIFGNNAEINVSGLFCPTTAREIKIIPIEEQEQKLLDNAILTIDTEMIEFIDIKGPIMMDEFKFEKNGSGSIALIGGKIELKDSYIHADTIMSHFDAGFITIKAKEIIVDHSEIRSMSYYGGNSGNILIKSLEDIKFSKDSTVITVSFGKNNAGNIEAHGRNIYFNESSGFGSQTYGQGKAGDITIEASASLFLGGSAKNNDNSCSFTSFSGNGDENIKNAGKAGNIIIKSNDMILMDGGKIVAGSRSPGEGGDICISISNSMLIQGENLKESIPELGFSSAISSFAKQEGDAGNIDINVGNNIKIKNHGEITTSSFASGNAGNISIKSSKLILENQGTISSGSYAEQDGGIAGKINIDCNKNIKLLSNSQLTTEAVNSRAGLNDQDNGMINVKSQGSVYLQQSSINTSVRSGSGNGGNIYSNSDQMILNHSKITANAFEGSGGNIYIASGQFIKSNDSIVQADSELGMSGNIYIHSPDINVEKDILEPSQMFMDASDLLTTACDKRSGDSIGRLIYEGQSGISFHPEDWIPGNFQFSNKVKQTGIIEIVKGESSFLNGYYKQSIKHLRSALLFLKNSSMDELSKNQLYVETMIGIAISYMKLGFYKNADRILLNLYPRIESYRTAYLESIYFNSLCDLSLAMGNTLFNDCLTKHLKKFNPNKNYITDYSKVKYLIKQAKKTKNAFIKAMVLNQMGIFLAIKMDYDKAMSLFSKSIEILDHTKKSKASDKLSIKVQINRLKTLMIKNDINKDDMIKYREKCLQDVELSIDENEIDPLDLISLSLILWKSNKELKNIKPVFKFHKYLSFAEKKALSLENNYIASQVFGMMGKIYEDEKNYKQALKATQKAIFYANFVNADEILVLWYQQSGRIYNKMGKTNRSFESYKYAINLINPLFQSCYSCNNDEIRPPGISHYFFSGYRNEPHKYFDKKIKPIFKEYLELLFLKTSDNNIENEQEVLTETRNVIETWISTEIQNYFKDECLMLYKKGMKTIDNGLSETAIIHPIILKNELNVLITLPDQIVQISKPFINNEDFVSLIKEFRNSLEIDKKDLKYKKLPPYNTNIASKLYDYIIRPSLKYFENYNIKTLVFVPTDELRNIPFSALYDGDHFLIEEYAIVNVPALLITDMKKQEIMPEEIFLGGITELPMVKRELYAIRDIMGNGKIMLDEAFSKNMIINEFKQNSYSVIILSTHAKFDGLQEKTFIKTFDDKLYMNDLEKMIRFGMFRKNRTELLILDACQTSKGNDQSSLGFSGIAIKSGAKSVIGSLWSVLDDFSYLFMVDFFKGIKNKYDKKMITKAQIFQSIQKQYIYDTKFNHPAYWSAFILLGNWL